MSPPRSRLPLRLYLLLQSWISVRLLLLQHPVRCLGWMSSDSSNCLLMTSSTLHPLVQTTDVTPWVSPSMDHCCVGCLGIRPLQVVLTSSRVRPYRTCPPLAWTLGVIPVYEARWLALGNRSTSPTSVRTTTPRMKATPGSVLMRSSALILA